MDHRERYDLATDLDPFHRIRVDTLAMADAAERDLTAPVEGCPGWTTADLVWHVLEVQFFWATVVGERLREPDGYTEPPRPGTRELVPALREGVEHLLDVLRAADPAEPVFTWASRQDAGWVVRHQVQEAAVHRWDAERAAGREAPLDAAAATDGVEEFLRYSTPFRVEGATPMGGSLLLEATDTGYRWLVREDAEGAAHWRRLDPTEPVTATTSAEAALTAPASDLLLYLYRRRAAKQLAPLGDEAVAERFALRNPTG
ncbi:maleylpyruvate isomerase family mycothiol-dependent enzyme [Pseudonocardia humida]|uniref:Maleylpyruvate isomerase family mycothiol-dependent enzyme n=1 Tax=Pseudonocardia humida TaxID=2800819 RepID=A0ABT1A0R4_9PSEU|nr:maleylpyruvate isomerase family mycothiol-dependent enzyme [Pseudonocardia humida]MCO1656593.1 maleylpyruvate isomerase family mycothiol-dependent enzyme [Pseudonocardia humida]